MVKYLFLDVETTGVDHKIHATHQISGCVVTDGIVREVFDFKIKPFQGSIIDQQALDVCGLTVDNLYDSEHLDECVIYEKLITILDKYVFKFDKKDKFYFVGYNNHFDKNFLYEFFVRNNNNFLFSYIWGNHIDVQVLATQHLLHDRPRMIDFKQGTVAKYLGFKVDEKQLHNSLYDLFICVGIFSHITGIKFDSKGVDFLSNIDAQIDSLSGNKNELTNLELNETFHTGKFKNKTVRFVLENEPSYICWFYNNLTNQTKISYNVYMAAQRLIGEKINENNNRHSGRKYLHEIPENILEHERKVHQKLTKEKAEAYE